MKLFSTFTRHHLITHTNFLSQGRPLEYQNLQTKIHGELSGIGAKQVDLRDEHSFSFYGALLGSKLIMQTFLTITSELQLLSHD